MLTPRRAPRLLVTTALLVLLAGCRDGDGGEAEGQSAPTELVDVGERPEIEPPEGQPPRSLVVEDLVAGDGDEVAEGSVLTVHYVGQTWEGIEFASSWERGQPLTYEHGQGRWIEGWEAGVEGMRVGGRRRIVVPPELGYGSRGAADVPPDATLVFVVDLLDVG